MSEKWTVERAWAWYNHQPQIYGCNFIPSTAINPLEMWQAETFDPATIDRELGWANSLGFNTVRVYLHDLLWIQDAVGFKSRIDSFLQICDHQSIKPIFVFFDDCWNSEFAIGKQPDPKPGVHNSGWVQSPGASLVLNPQSWCVLKDYVQDILSTFKHDERIRLWDLYNEPGNRDLKENSLGLLKAIFQWAREIDLDQPISAGVWFDNDIFNEFQIDASDIVTFHDYFPVEHLIEQIHRLKTYGRPLICTEYMARTRGSFFETHLPVFKSEHVGAINWGLVSGKTNTIYQWGVPLGEREPEIWFHDIFRKDGTPYDPREVAIIKSLTA